MSFEVKVPAVGESIASGMIAQWHKKTGAPVKRGDILVTIETDKVSTDLEAEEEGVLEIVVAEGEEVPIGAVIAHIATAAGAPEVQITADAQPAPEPAPEAAVGPDGAAPQAPDPEPTAPAPAPAPALAPAPEIEPAPRLTVVPAEAGDEAKPARESKATAPSAAAPVDNERVTRRKMSPLRRKIATHLVSAQQNAAILTTFNECDMGAIMDLRKQLQESFVARHGIKLGFMSFFVKAAVAALREVPGINARVDGDDVVIQHYYDLGVAVSTEKGLVVPVIRDCDEKSFAGIEQAIAEAAGKARDGTLTIEDLQGGVFTISNGGIYGSMLSTPILNPPQSGILGMHTIQQRPVARDGEVVIRPMMYLALSYDHRIVDGKEAVTFLRRVVDCIEAPERMLVEA